jgi:hypothetical protein
MSIDTVNIILVATVVLLATSLSVFVHRTLTHLQGEVRRYRFLHESVLDEAREWEKKALTYSTEARELRFELDESENELDELKGDKFKPVREGEQSAHDFDITLMPDDDVWNLVRQCEDLMPLWELKMPGIATQLPHRRYSEFAQFVGNLCDEHRNREGVERAIDTMACSL